MFQSGNFMNPRLMQLLAQRMPQGGPPQMAPQPAPQLPGAKDPRFMQSLTSLMNFLRQRQQQQPGVDTSMGTGSGISSRLEALLGQHPIGPTPAIPPGAIEAKPMPPQMMQPAVMPPIQQPPMLGQVGQPDAMQPPMQPSAPVKTGTPSADFSTGVYLTSKNPFLAPGQLIPKPGDPYMPPKLMPPGGYPTKGQPQAPVAPPQMGNTNIMNMLREIGQSGVLTPFPAAPPTPFPPPMQQPPMMPPQMAPQPLTWEAMMQPVMPAPQPPPMPRQNMGRQNFGMAPDEQMFARGGFAVKRPC
jgi:hypothetical protein